jgi:type IV pilus assembly protein PilV
MRRRSQSGFSLLEVLIALVVLAIGLLGIASLQITSSQYSESGLHRSQASALARELFERMRVNPVEAKAGQYDIATLPSLVTNCESAEAECTPAQLREHDLRVWSGRVATLLPGADAAITTSEDNGEDPVDITITLQWDNSRGQRAAVVQSFSFQLMGLGS